MNLNVNNTFDAGALMAIKSIDAIIKWYYAISVLLRQTN